MENRLTDYTFTIIEDGQVPLAGNFDTFSFAPVIMVVVATLLVLAAITYIVWVNTHTRRVGALTGNMNASVSEYLFHPLKLLRTEAELEYEAISDLSQNIA